MQERAQRVISRALVKAAGQPLALAAAGLAATTGLIVHSSTLFLVAAAGWVASFAVRLNRDRVWRESVDEIDLEEAELPSNGVLHDARCQRFLHRLAATRSDRGVIVRSFEGGGTASVRSVLKTAGALERQSLVLLHALDRMASHAGARAAEALAIELERLQRQSEATSSVAARLEGERASATVRARLLAVDQMERWNALLEARLESLLAALESLPARLIRADVCQASQRTLQDEAPLLALGEYLEDLDAVARAADELPATTRPPVPQA